MKLAPQSIPYRAFQRVVGIVILLFFLASANDWGLLIGGAVAAAVLLVSVGYEVAYYRRFEYELTDDTLDISSGVISRREREIPYRRIQNVDVSRSVIQRAIGVAAVDLETAGGSSTEGSIRFVTPEEATRLQREVQRRKSDASPATGTDENGDPVGPTEEDLFAISPRELALVGALSFDGRLIGLLAFLGSGSFPVLSGFLPDTSAAVLTAFAIVAVGVLFLVSWVIGAGLAFSNYYGFRLSRAGNELRYERGLFRRYSGSIPTEKVQTLTISDNPAKRALGYASLSIETAGYAPGQGGDYGSQAAVPIASTDRVYELAREVESFGEPSFSRPPKRIRWRYVFRYAMMVGVLAAIAFAVDWYVVPDVPWVAPLGLLLVVPVAAHLKWKHRGYWLAEDHLLTRNGFWSREVKAVPYYRIQNVIDSRTIFQRRWNVATIVADTAGTGSLVGSDAAAIDFDIDEAIELRDELRTRLQDALSERRARRTAFEWFEGDVGERPVDDRDDEDGSAADDDSPAPAAADDSPAPAADDDSVAGVDDSVTDADEGIDPPEDGVVRPDFSTSTRDYSEPAERVDTGEYAVDRFPSDADVAHRPEVDENDGDSAEDDESETYKREGPSGNEDDEGTDPSENGREDDER
ncbi:putative membrane protein [Halorubrum alkaliphilum]|uniref:Putative membrane protein n=1 Tax=Halorubrum alkaliphilum TaxID=261290 RepID=A0A8T4GEJ5_9EURY|nr:PH domain-containing protein [Halorubrum alkaliphilum]MBP1922070.1 putative membrane protein [Halorubrum alkaliphilum]